VDPEPKERQREADAEGRGRELLGEEDQADRPEQIQRPGNGAGNE
jgi:hypothetical protein